ncbi:hypothetical protein EGR_09119 [Echinococcus granulosus]|uniref:Uncharacterized protein n=1 Tax=Echinococcus granulosus TaxID=6210 RepID=W6URN0_ECHGR|nr:hypothetical protein EGR_09119 [Echinococcus granulosus]EUB56039.1 hypothetical protein EGR_09119 [Echinococcus granulosus]
MIDENEEEEDKQCGVFSVATPCTGAATAMHGKGIQPNIAL